MSRSAGGLPSGFDTTTRPVRGVSRFGQQVRRSGSTSSAAVSRCRPALSFAAN